MNRPRPTRRAVVLVATLLCLMVALSIATTMIAETLARRVQLRAEQNARQAELLVQAGRGRAIARLTADAAYRGERWTPAIGRAQAAIDIAIESTADGAAEVTITAAYPDDSPQAVRRSRVFVFAEANLQNEE